MIESKTKHLIGDWLSGIAVKKNQDYNALNLLNIQSFLKADSGSFTPEEAATVESLLVDMVRLVVIMNKDENKTDELTSFLLD